MARTAGPKKFTKKWGSAMTLSVEEVADGFALTVRVKERYTDRFVIERVKCHDLEQLLEAASYNAARVAMRARRTAPGRGVVKNMIEAGLREGHRAR